MCVLPNHQFYFYILAVSSALLCVYILCNLYNLVKKISIFFGSLFNVFKLQCWIIWPQMGLMYRVIRKYRDEMNICTIEPRKPFINHENFLNVYFDRWVFFSQTCKLSSHVLITLAPGATKISSCCWTSWRRRVACQNPSESWLYLIRSSKLFGNRR